MAKAQGRLMVCHLIDKMVMTGGLFTLSVVTHKGPVRLVFSREGAKDLANIASDRLKAQDDLMAEVARACAETPITER